MTSLTSLASSFFRGLSRQMYDELGSKNVSTDVGRINGLFLVLRDNVMWPIEGRVQVLINRR